MHRLLGLHMVLAESIGDRKLFKICRPAPSENRALLVRWPPVARIDGWAVRRGQPLPAVRRAGLRTSGTPMPLTGFLALASGRLCTCRVVALCCEAPRRLLLFEKTSPAGTERQCIRKRLELDSATTARVYVPDSRDSLPVACPADHGFPNAALAITKYVGPFHFIPRMSPLCGLQGPEVAACSSREGAPCSLRTRRGYLCSQLSMSPTRNVRMRRKRTFRWFDEFCPSQTSACPRRE